MLAPVKKVAVTPELVELMQYVVEVLDSSEEDERNLAEIDDGLQTEHGVGGRAPDGKLRFELYPPARGERWSMVLTEEAVRAVADGAWTTLPVEVSAAPLGTRRPLALVPAGTTPQSRGRAMLDALVELDLVTLSERARVAEIAAALEKVALEIIDHPSAGDAAKAAAIAEALMDLPGIDDVFGEDAEVYEVVKRFAE